MNRRILILGAGESGVGAAILAKKEGYQVFVSDGGVVKEQYQAEMKSWGIDYEEGGHSDDKINWAQEVMKSPGIPHKSPFVKKLVEKGVLLISDIELAYRHKGASRIIGITGSNGKTTTTALTYYICKTAGLDCAMVGNIGISFARQVAVDPKELYITEISSFQLDDIVEFRPDVAVLTNITEDHLDRYDYSFENYIRAKFNIVKNQVAGDSFIYCEDDPVTMQYINQIPFLSKPLPFAMSKELPRGAYINNNHMVIQGPEPFTMSIYDFALKGKHNQYNTMAACLSATVMDIRKQKIRDAVISFKGLEHRLEFVAMIRGVEFINDSKATNVNSTWFALESMQKPVILILGGVDKGNDYTSMMELVKEKVKAIVCMGADNTKIHKAFGHEVEVMVNTASAKEAVHAAFRLADKGDVVLLSPACASFDLFKNYEDRGRQFKEAVREL